jgi:recombinational DNA repair ATPase RecF
MKLDFRKSHRSINSFSSVEIPNFSIIVGVNGSGKTHLLESIHNGSIENDVAVNSLSSSPIKLL